MKDDLRTYPAQRGHGRVYGLRKPRKLSEHQKTWIWAAVVVIGFLWLLWRFPVALDKALDYPITGDNGRMVE